MSSSHKLGKLFSITLLGAALLAGFASSARAGTGVYVNGIELTYEQYVRVGQSLGYVPPPGQYIVYGGCVAHLDSGQLYCPPVGANGGYGQGGGYGGDNGGGAWFSRGSDYSGGYSVGGDGSGCIYTPDWSNC